MKKCGRINDPSLFHIHPKAKNSTSHKDSDGEKPSRDLINFPITYNIRRENDDNLGKQGLSVS